MLMDISPELRNNKPNKASLSHVQRLYQNHKDVVSTWRKNRRVKSNEQKVSDELRSQEGSSAVQEIKKIYAEHNPDGLSKVPALLEKYSGREEELLSKVKEKYVSPPEFGEEPAAGKSSGTRTFITFRINNKGGQTVKFQLYDDVAPLACENFRSLCAGDKVGFIL